MKKLVSIIIVAQIFSSAINSGGLGIELMRSINLFHHYLEHQDENANLMALKNTEEE
ncbi:MAG: hypothetical protein ACKOZY_11725 [Flavobacteriales bacterium]